MGFILFLVEEKDWKEGEKKRKKGMRSEKGREQEVSAVSKFRAIPAHFSSIYRVKIGFKLTISSEVSRER